MHWINKYYLKYLLFSITFYLLTQILFKSIHYSPENIIFIYNRCGDKILEEIKIYINIYF